MATITSLGTHRYHEELTLNSQTCSFVPSISLLLKHFKSYSVSVLVSKYFKSLPPVP
jgi:hypothetical protein